MNKVQSSILRLMEYMIPEYKDFMDAKRARLAEGIDFDLRNKRVIYNPSHPNNVNTSVEDNPTCDYLQVDICGTKHQILVFSIFKRNINNGSRDGNPLIYALKGENGWRFRGDEDREAINQQFKAIANKFCDFYKGEATVIVPSNSILNPYIVEIMREVNPAIVLFDKLIRKMSTEEILDICDADGSVFRQYYDNRLEEAYSELEGFLKAMNEQHGGMYARHFVKDAEMRDVLTRTMTVTADNDYIKRFVESVNGKPVLIIDDTISRGHSLKEVCEIILSEANPSMVTCLTLMSSTRNL